MSRHYLLDGYNVLYAMREFPKGTWQAKREHLLAFLQKHVLQGHNALTVVFDSREGPGSTTQTGTTAVVYTSGETADERIIDMVRVSANPRVMIIVSNDKGIRLMLKGTGAQFMSATDFLKKKDKAAMAFSPSPEPSADPAITEELSKKWL